MNGNIRGVFIKLSGSVLVTFLILIIARFSYNKGKFNCEVKLEGLQEAYPIARCIKLGYSGLFNRQKKHSLIYSYFLKYKENHDVLFFYYFDLESSHKEIVVVLKAQPDTLLTSPLGPPQLRLLGQLNLFCHDTEFENMIPQGIYFIQEHYSFGLKERVSIKYWKGETSQLLKKFMRDKLEPSPQKFDIPFTKPSLLHRLLNPDESITISTRE